MKYTINPPVLRALGGMILVMFSLHHGYETMIRPIRSAQDLRFTQEHIVEYSQFYTPLTAAQRYGQALDQFRQEGGARAVQQDSLILLELFVDQHLWQDNVQGYQVRPNTSLEVFTTSAPIVSVDYLYFLKGTDLLRTLILLAVLGVGSYLVLDNLLSLPDNTPVFSSPKGQSKRNPPSKAETSLQ